MDFALDDLHSRCPVDDDAALEALFEKELTALVRELPHVDYQAAFEQAVAWALHRKPAHSVARAVGAAYVELMLSDD